MSVQQAVVVVIAAAGLVITYWVSVRGHRARHLKESVIPPGKFSWAEEHQVRQAVHRGVLPGDPALHAVAIGWAREETTYVPAARIWLIWQPVGVAVALSGLYLIPGFAVDVIVAVVQVIIIVAGLGGVRFVQSGLAPARALLSKYADDGADGARQ